MSIVLILYLFLLLPKKYLTNGFSTLAVSTNYHLGIQRLLQ